MAQFALLYLIEFWTFVTNFEALFPNFLHSPILLIQ